MGLRLARLDVCHLVCLVQRAPWQLGSPQHRQFAKWCHWKHGVLRFCPVLSYRPWREDLGHPLRSRSDSYCWLGVRKSIRSVKIEWWGVGVVVCLEQGADSLHMVQLMPLHPKTPSSLVSLKLRLVLPGFLVPAYPGCPGKEAVKRV